jgi:hypothetical protein
MARRTRGEPAGLKAVGPVGCPQPTILYMALTATAWEQGMSTSPADSATKVAGVGQDPCAPGAGRAPRCYMVR